MACSPLFACRATLTPPATISQSQSPATGALLPYSFRTQAFDGSQLWQILREDGQSHLIKQSLSEQKLSRLQAPAAIPLHRSLAWSQNKLWLLDYDDRIHQIDPETGKVLTVLELKDLPEKKASEQIAFNGEELWLLMRAYVSAQNKLEPARLIRLDPVTGKNLETKVIPGAVDPQPRPSIGFSDFLHQNLSADDKAFYVLRSALFEAHHNLLYRIDKQTLEITHRPLNRIFTGVPTLFFWQGQPWGIELVDTTNCGELCRGRLEKLPVG